MSTRFDDNLNSGLCFLYDTHRDVRSLGVGFDSALGRVRIFEERKFFSFIQRGGPNLRVGSFHQHLDLVAADGITGNGAYPQNGHSSATGAEDAQRTEYTDAEVHTSIVAGERGSVNDR